MRMPVAALCLCVGIFLLLLISPVSSSGAAEKAERSVGRFSSVSFQTFGKVIIEQNGTEYVKIDAPDNVVGRITTEVRKGTLYIGYRGLFRNHSIEPLIFIGMKDISTLSVSSIGGIEAEKILGDKLALDSSGSGYIRIESIEANELDIRMSSSGNLRIGSSKIGDVSAHISGSGDLVISGNVNNMKLNCSSSGSFDGEDFIVNGATVNLSSSGSAVFQANNRIEADISSRGILSYYGTPVVVPTRSDSRDKLRGLGLRQ